MALFSTAWHLVGIFFVFLLGALIALSIRRLFYCNPVRTLALYCWHSFFSIVYAIYVVNKGGDATRYYNNSLLDGTSFAFGTRGIEFFTSFFSQGKCFNEITANNTCPIQYRFLIALFSFLFRIFLPCMDKYYKT